MYISAAPYEGPVAVAVLIEPQGAVEVGTLSLRMRRGKDDLQGIVERLSEETRAMGGNLLKIDDIEEIVSIESKGGEMPDQSYEFRVRARAMLVQGGGK